MSNYDELKRLAEAALRNWPDSKLFERPECERFIDAARPEVILALIAENERLERLALDSVNAEYAGSMDLESICAERDQLRAEVAGLRTGYQAYERVNAELKAEVKKIDSDRKACWTEFKVQGRRLDELKAENEALRKDAARLNWLDGQSRPVVEGQCMSNPEGELAGYDWGIFGQCSTVREAIDYAMTSGDQP